jgi:hypothetical protein
MAATTANAHRTSTAAGRNTSDLVTVDNLLRE